MAAHRLRSGPSARPPDARPRAKCWRAAGLCRRGRTACDPPDRRVRRGLTWRDARRAVGRGHTPRDGCTTLSPPDHCTPARRAVSFDVWTRSAGGHEAGSRQPCTPIRNQRTRRQSPSRLPADRRGARRRRPLSRLAVNRLTGGSRGICAAGKLSLTSLGNSSETDLRATAEVLPTTRGKTAAGSPAHREAGRSGILWPRSGSRLQSLSMRCRTEFGVRLVRTLALRLAARHDHGPGGRTAS